MDRKRIAELADAILAEAEANHDHPHFDMGYWYGAYIDGRVGDAGEYGVLDEALNRDCGTTACAAGMAVVKWGDDDDFAAVRDDVWECQNVGKRLLDLTYARHFFVEDWPYEWRIAYAKARDAFAKTRVAAAYFKALSEAPSEDEVADPEPEGV